MNCVLWRNADALSRVSVQSTPTVPNLPPHHPQVLEFTLCSVCLCTVHCALYTALRKPFVLLFPFEHLLPRSALKIENCGWFSVHSVFTCSAFYASNGYNMDLFLCTVFMLYSLCVHLPCILCFLASSDCYEPFAVHLVTAVFTLCPLYVL